MRKRTLAASTLFFCLAFFVFRDASAAKYNIRWVMIHEPSETAEAAARGFAARIEKATAGDIHVEILTRADYRKKNNDDQALSPASVMSKISEGNLEMCQTYTTFLSRYNRDLYALGLPYLFRDYDHAERVFEGPIGKELKKTQTNAPVRLLAFTYSGGFGLFATKQKPARKPSDLRGLRLEIGRGVVYSGALSNALDIEPIITVPEAFVPLAEANLVDGVETTFARLAEYGDDRYAKAIVNTEHYLLSTAIVVNKKFFESLPSKYQVLMEEMAMETGRQERQHSINLIRESRKKLEGRGVTIVDLTPEERAAYQKALEPVYLELAPLMSDRIAQRIRDAGAVPLAAHR